MEEIIRLRLQAEVDGVSVDWNQAPQGAGVPRLVLYTISDVTIITNDGQARLRRARVQVDCYAATYGAAKLVSRAVNAALSGWRDGATIQGAFAAGARDLPPDTGAGETLGRVSLDFFINYEES